MDNPSVILREVSKSFVIKHNAVDSLKVKMVGLVNPRQREQRDKFWALRDINLLVKEGEFLGLIGPNGSGKSTLLRLIAKIFPPTEGQVLTQGRVVPMIELGIGFHPDLTGRENIYLNTSLYGLSRKKTDQLYNQIVDFSEMATFIDQPAKNYSLGMYMRLGFSAAVHLDPDILLIDEVLAVGDEHFQKKCLKRMEQIHKSGKTVILVSHELESIRSMCTRVCFLRQGKVEVQGEPSEIIQYYHDLLNREDNSGDITESDS
jgi:ABC-type polysaccharide/polyol phosphate transport system ATPase subunit